MTKPKKLTGRGGPNRGQGRKHKYGEETVIMRVPKSLVAEVKKLMAKKLTQ